MCIECDYLELRKAVEEIYYAAHWIPDREVNTAQLWENLRDAADLPRDQSPQQRYDASTNS